MSSYVTGAAVSATSIAFGYGANALRERGVRREALKAARSAELHQALREYMAALDAVMLEVEDFPVPLHVTALDRWVERTLEGTPVDVAGHLFGRWVKRHAYGSRHDDLSDRLVAASARRRLVAPPHVEALMREVEDLMREHRAGGPQLMESWRPLRGRLRQQFKDTLGESAD
jgi:hypothetical protein